MQPDEEPQPLDALDSEMRNVAARTRKMLTWFLIALVAVVIAFAAGAAVLLRGESGLQDRSACEVRYNYDYAEVQQIRTQLTNESNDAVQNLINAVFMIRPGQSRAQQDADIGRAYATFKATEKRVAQERATHPVPKVPSC
jgi:hypothetical protein